MAKAIGTTADEAMAPPTSRRSSMGHCRPARRVARVKKSIVRNASTRCIRAGRRSMSGPHRENILGVVRYRFPNASSIVLARADMEKGFCMKMSPAEVATRLIESSAVAMIIFISGLTLRILSAACMPFIMGIR